MTKIALSKRIIIIVMGISFAKIANQAVITGYM
ncbi:hypothetical protein C5L23_001555 [Leuconostoc fallax]|uniref:Uncharacterized protein n=1 Tax=Leuconostoc fallax TaxID=1251 RepID=A0A4R5N8I3_9LACO|nr:hypothetical protein C5L23_001555 [Leuconostoc fallax]